MGDHIRVLWRGDDSFEEIEGNVAKRERRGTRCSGRKCCVLGGVKSSTSAGVMGVGVGNTTA